MSLTSIPDLETWERFWRSLSLEEQGDVIDAAEATGIDCWLVVRDRYPHLWERFESGGRA